MDMALRVDIRNAVHAVRFSERYVRVGLVPGDGGCYYLPQIVGQAESLRLLWSGDVVDSAEALRLEIVSAVHPNDKSAGDAQKSAAMLVARPPVAVELIKRAVRDGARRYLRTALDLVSSYQAAVLSTDGPSETSSTLVERREPQFAGTEGTRLAAQSAYIDIIFMVC